MMRVPAFALLLSGCAPVAAPVVPVEPVVDPSRPQPDAILLQSRAVLERDALAALGPAVLAEVRAAPASVLMRRMNSLPRMIQQPDGSWKSEPAAVVAAVRTDSGWVRITSDGRTGFDAGASAQLDRLLGGPELWAEPPIESGSCTDPSGNNVLLRSGGQERMTNFPCGFVGRAGEAAQIVLAGAIVDWTGVPRELRPAGLPLRRFPPEAVNAFGLSSGIYEPRRIEIRSAPEWEGQWRRLTARQGHPPPPPAVDFTRDMLLMAAMGPRSTGGYRVVIDRVLPRSEQLEVFVREISPGPRCGTIQAVTSPVDIVIVPATPRSVRWIVEQEVADCP